MFEKLIATLSNPILFYADKEGHIVFRNFNWISNTGCMYNLQLSKLEAGKVLEYRFEIEKYLKTAYWLVPLVIYLIFIHVKFSLGSLLLAEFFWILLVNIARGVCSYIYSNYLLKNFGQYELVEFRPNLPKEKWEQYRANFNSKIIITAIVLVIFFAPALILQYSLKLCVSTKKRHPDAAIKIAQVYNAVYPTTENIYDILAYAKYTKRDLEGALKDYKTALEMSGKRFTKKDFARFANLLYLEKKVTSPENAVVVFNDYATRKDMSVLQQSQMLWIKSIFSVENDMPEAILSDYNDLLASLDSKDTRNQFYISSDKAYVLYLMKDYESAINTYNLLISYAEGNKKQYANELKSLYAERGFAKKQLGDNLGADADFVSSGVDIMYELDKYEPSYTEQQFVVGF